MTRILVVNQHGSNRGDEAACRGMLYGVRRFVPDAEIVLLTVYPLCLDGVADVTVLENLPLRGLRARKALLRILRYLVGFYTGVNTSPHMAEIFAQYRRADLIISAPGGPYIGNLYPWTELELLFHIMLGTLTSSPVMIYAPSMGPFRGKLRNFWRKRALEGVDLITVRESISAKYLCQLGIGLPNKYVTADSALQRPVDSDLGELVFAREGLDPSQTYIGFVPLELARFSDENKQMRYIELIVHSLRLLADRFDANVVFFPQGYGAWRDTPFLEFISSVAAMKRRIHILSEDCNSDDQQALVGKMDAFVSFRYHPTIFALRQSVPCVVVAYEHKVRGFMRAVGMEDFCLSLQDVTAGELLRKMEEIWQEREQMRRRVQPRIQLLELESLKNSFLASLLLEYKSQPHPTTLHAFIDGRLHGDPRWSR